MAYLGLCKLKIADSISETTQRITQNVGSVLALLQSLDYSSKLPLAISTEIKGCAAFLRVIFTELVVDQEAIRPYHYLLAYC